ncbi:MAG: sulfatase-like hydrolase/transferase [Zavarzinella sp.]
MGKELTRPNIIIILSDDAGYNEFSAHGSKLFPTPRIDSIAKNGVMCTQGYVSGTVCSPTRAGLLTGRYQNRFGHEFNIPPVYSETNGLSLEETTIADVLKQAEYRTIALGKWHLGYAPKFHPMERGFTDYFGFLQGARSYFPQQKSSVLNRLLRDREPIPEKFEYMTDELAKQAANYITKHKSQPFFMYLAFNATHSPNHTLPADEKLFDDGNGKIKLRAMTAALDRAVGVVLDRLQELKLTDNTLVIFLNDNGGAAGHDNAPLRGQKGSTWEGGIRVPFLLQWPAQLPAGVRYEKPVISLDLFPTVMGAAGIQKSTGKPLDGVNLLPYLTKKQSGEPHQTLFWKNGTAYAVRDGNWKLVLGNKQATQPELFDLKEDPEEKTDVTKMNPEIAKSLQEKYRTWKKDFPKPTWGGAKDKD